VRFAAQSQERILHDVLGTVPVTQQAVRVPQQRAFVLAHDRVQPRRVMLVTVWFAHGLPPEEKRPRPSINKNDLHASFLDDFRRKRNKPEDLAHAGTGSPIPKNDRYG
jgi:hypothetical protein